MGVIITGKKGVNYYWEGEGVIIIWKRGIIIITGKKLLLRVGNYHSEEGGWVGNESVTWEGAKGILKQITPVGVSRTAIWMQLSKGKV